MRHVLLAFMGALMLGWRAHSAFACPAAPPEVHYAPEEDLEKVDAGLIDGAGERIDLAAYILTDAPVVEALRLAAERGVQVRILRDPSEAGKTGAADVARLARTPGVAMRLKAPGELMHLKAFAVDGCALRTGSANLTWHGERRQDNDLVILWSETAAQKFEARFGKAWEAAR